MLSSKEIAKIVEDLLNKRAQERKKELLRKRQEEGGFIVDVHEAEIGIDPDNFEIISQHENDDGSILIEWKATEYVLTEFTVDEPHQFIRRGKLLIRDDKYELVEVR